MEGLGRALALELGPLRVNVVFPAHYFVAFAFFALILMHVAAILFHKLVRNDGVFEAMAPIHTPEKGD